MDFDSWPRTQHWHFQTRVVFDPLHLLICEREIFYNVRAKRLGILSCMRWRNKLSVCLARGWYAIGLIAAPLSHPKRHRAGKLAHTYRSVFPANQKESLLVMTQLVDLLKQRMQKIIQAVIQRSRRPAALQPQEPQEHTIRESAMPWSSAQSCRHQLRKRTPHVIK